MWAQGHTPGCVLLVGALQAGAHHSPHTVPACFQGLQQNQELAGLSIHPGPSQHHPLGFVTESAGAWECCQFVGRLGAWSPIPPLLFSPLTLQQGDHTLLTVR